MAAEQYFLVAGDYAVFGVMLAVSLAIGIYYSIKDRGKENGVQNYLMAGRKMNVFAVGFSLSFTFLSASAVLGIPADVYLFGTMFFWVLITPFILMVVVTQIYIPLYFRLNITSSYEYLELRFSYPVRLLGTLGYIAQNAVYIGVMIYAPALAFAQGENNFML
uniref:sodium-coupled monocarboxylate transporter 1-like n=1 Tax=Styela clava TaxID=7725 RepID=UPI00193ADEF9|nr:sodium-coupled monocarboxylate transporter 1-like [Styela clava]